jgi:hypothetical protein
MRSMPQRVGSLSLLLAAACAASPSGTTGVSGSSGSGSTAGSTGGSTSGSTTGGQLACQATTPSVTLYSNECTPAQNTTFCLFTQNTGF